MVTETDRDEALKTLLTEQVNTRSGARSRTAAGLPSGNAPQRRERQRVGIITGTVLVAVVALTTLVLTFGAPATLPPAGSSPTTLTPSSHTGPSSSPPISPTPGQVLLVMSSDDGASQTRDVHPGGMSLRIDYTCSGLGTFAYRTPGNRMTYPDPQTSLAAGDECGRGSSTDSTGAQGPYAIHVSSTGKMKWTVTVTAVN